MKEAAKKPLQGIKVLVAEDEAIIAFDIMLTLSQAGAAVIGPAMNIHHALQLANKEDLDCAVLDVRLGRELVFPAAEVLNEKGVSIVFHTGHVDPDALRRDWRGTKVLTKSAPLRMLMYAVAEAAKQRNAAPMGGHP